MAGDWIKVEHCTVDKPEVYRIAHELGIAVEAVLGHLLRVWIWADQQSVNGHALSVTDVTLDSVSRCDGLGAAMRSVGWIEGDSWQLSIPNFERHNGKSAKKRALAAERKARERVTNKSRSKRDRNAPREEESITPPSPPRADVRVRISREQDSGAFARLCQELGIGSPPRGYTLSEAKKWAIDQTDRIQ